MTILTTVGAVFAKVETTPGVDASPVQTGSPNDFILAIDANFAPDFQVIERNYLRPAISAVPLMMGRQLATLTFTTEIFGTNVAAVTTTTTTQKQATPKWADLFLGCGMVGTAIASPAGQTFTPVTTSQQTLTLYCYFNGLLHKLLGAMGTYQMTLMAGQIGKIAWTFTGVYQAPTAVALPAPVFPAFYTPPLVQSLAFQIGSTASTVFVPEQVTFDLANVVTPREDANSIRGFNSMIITDRTPQFTFSPEQVPEASHPFWTDFAAANGKTMTFTVGGTAGNQMIGTFTNMQISNLQYADRNGIRAYEVTGRLSSITGAGNDEITWTFQ